MASIGQAHIKITPDTSGIERVLNVLAEHFARCADELASLRAEESLKSRSSS